MIRFLFDTDIHIDIDIDIEIEMFYIVLFFQYFVYGGYFIAISILYMIIGILNIIRHCKKGAGFKIWVQNTEVQNN